MMPKRTADYWINRLNLSTHIEGGAFREIYRSPVMVPKPALPLSFSGSRSFCTSIYFLLKHNQFSAFHKIKSDEIWHFYYGDALLVYEINEWGQLQVHRLGNDPDKRESFQCVITAGNWFAARLAPGGDYALVGCTVAPGFDFADFELAKQQELIGLFPEHKEIIKELTI